jgi:hypothetical protein
MKRDVPEPLLIALRKALDKHSEAMIRVARDMNLHNERAFVAAGRKVNELWETCLKVPYKEAA